MKVSLYKEKPIAVIQGDPGFCPKKKGGRRYQAEVLQEMCRKCRVKAKYCPDKLRRHRKERKRDSERGNRNLG
jgi:Pyruvate/2-oxoacid:ferredoxin oxidoreductase delta subunit